MKNLFISTIAILTLSMTACGSKGGGTTNSSGAAPVLVDTNADSTMVEGATPKSDGSSSKLLKAPTQDLGSMDPTPPALPASAPEKKPEPKPEPKPQPKPAVKIEAQPDSKVPTLIEVTAHAEVALRAVPTSGAHDKIISSLSGKLIVDKSEPRVENPILNFVGVDSASIVTPDMGRCELLAKNFDMRDAGKTVVFTLMGTDEKSEPATDGCLVKLSTMAMGGFVIEFKNVRLGGPLSETFVPTVRLNVAPFKTDTK